MATRIMAVRHAVKGDGTNAPKNHLSPQGEADARELGKNLPASMKTAPINYVGGSIHSRSGFTALLIAVGAGADPQILPSRIELGSENQFWAMTSKDAFNAAMETHGKNMTKATRAILAPADFDLLKQQMLDVVKECGNLGGNVILGTHNPWIQMLFEGITGKEYNGNAAELDYVVMDVENGNITLVETSLPQ